MKNLIPIFFLAFFTFSLKASAQSILPNVGDLISEASIKSLFSIARIETDKQMCSPAVLVGPRVFLTAAHCTPLIPPNGLIKVYGPGFSKSVHVNVVTMPVLSDDDFFMGEVCKALIQNLPDGATLSFAQLAKCWFKDGASDIALLVADQDIQSPMLSLGASPVEKSEIVDRLGENAECGGDLGFFHRVHLKFFAFQQSQMILDNTEMGPNQSNLSDCGGDSGGIYYRILPDGSINIVGIHSASVSKTGPYVIYGKKISLPLGLFGGTNLLATEPNRWLRDQVAKFGLLVCGINLSCAGVRLN